MTPIVVKMFVTNVGELSQASGNTTRQVQMSHQRGPNAATPGPNDGLFDSRDAGNISLALANVSEAIKSQFKGGQKIKVTIEDDVV